jgi:HK97 gp10 family phage protein
MKVVVEFNRLPSSAKSARAAIGQALSDGAVKVQADAQQLAPVDTGRLRSGIHTEKLGDLSYSVENDTSYAVHQEYGTRYQRGTPHMRPAYERNRQGIINDARKALSSLS